MDEIPPLEEDWENSLFTDTGTDIITGPVFLSVGSEAKLDMFNTFDLDKQFDLQLDPPSSKNPPLCRIIQEGKDPILTTDFYLTNVRSKTHDIHPLVTPSAALQQKYVGSSHMRVYNNVETAL